MQKRIFPQKVVNRLFPWVEAVVIGLDMKPGRILDKMLKYLEEGTWR